MKKILRNIVIVLAFAGIWFYIFHPAINFHSAEFWLMFLCVAALALILHSFRTVTAYRIRKKNEPAKPNLFSRIDNFFSRMGKSLQNFGAAVLLIVVVLVIQAVVSGIYSPLFMAKKYANRIKVTNVDFNEIPAYSFNKTAIIDRDSSEILGDKVMGQMTDLVSQFRVSNEYSQISYKEGTYRVTPLAYDSIIKYFRNRSEGIPGYIIVNTTTGETRLVRLTDKMHYVPSAMFNENFYRKLRFDHPFTIFGDPTFEIDEEGNPFYVCTTYTYQGYRSLRRVTGVIIFDPVTGSSEKYALGEIPSWVDRVYPEDLVEDELNDYGAFQKGYWNSVFGQEGVIKTSRGYNYLSKDGDIWLYTGMTSVSSDDSNVGFMLVDLRTHEAQFISSSGASEYAAMASAEGEVLNYGYTATFPVLVNINDSPTYLLSLKDSAGLIKMYALVDAQDYQQVYTIKADKNAETAIFELIRSATGKTPEPTGETKNATIVLHDVRTVIMGGETYVYLKDGEDIYRIVLTEDNASYLLYLSEGDTLELEYYDGENEKIVTNVSR